MEDYNQCFEKVWSEYKKVNGTATRIPFNAVKLNETTLSVLYWLHPKSDQSRYYSGQSAKHYPQYENRGIGFFTIPNLCADIEHNTIIMVSNTELFYPKGSI